MELVEVELGGAARAALLDRSIADGTLRLVLPFEPPGWSVRTALQARAARASDLQVSEALSGSCSFVHRDAERQCVTTEGCSGK